MSLIDPQGRTIDYLRVSVTDRCNLGCVYCRPWSSPPVREADRLTNREITSFCREAAALGIRHIKITGGEPLLRKDCCALIAELKKIPGIDTVTLTTNGTLLRRYLPSLIDAGTDGINVSLDTLNPRRYEAITGSDCLNEVMAGIKEAAGALIPLKINCVTMQDFSQALMAAPDPLSDYFALAELARSLAVDVRFIEEMPIGMSSESFSRVCFDHRRLTEAFLVRYPEMTPTAAIRGCGPAVYYQIPDFEGCIGFISALHHNFCQSCNRIRLTSQGVLKGCLGFEGTICLKPLFREAALEEEVLKEKQLEETQLEEKQFKETQFEENQFKKTQFKEKQFKEEQFKETQVKEKQVKEKQVKEEQVKETQLQEALKGAILEVVRQKPPCHRFGEQHPQTEREGMSKIGG